MKNDILIQSGIKRENIEELNKYLMHVENEKNNNVQELFKVIDEYPGILYEPKAINEDICDINDLAFIFSEDGIIGHVYHKISKVKTDVGSRITVSLLEKNVIEEIPTNCLDAYLMERINGLMETRVIKNEKSR